jgi:hypothetical protein
VVKSDIRLFVHAAKEGELDAMELALVAELCADGDPGEGGQHDPNSMFR